MIRGLDWIAADWGTTNLRVWAMGRGDAVLARAESAAGMASLTPAGFEPALLALVGAWLGAVGVPVPVVACGMVGARQGWAEAPYAAVPALPLAPGRTVRPRVADARLAVHILPGLRQDRPADVMRGEETQIAGFLAGQPDFDGVLCLPGTHTKWAHVSAGEVVSFQTFMTGEMFALLSRQSVLRHGVADTGWDAHAFAHGVDQTLARPERLAAYLFSIRAEGLIAGLAPAAARSQLSGLLIGAELAAARPYWLGRSVVVIGGGAGAKAYVTALSAQGVTPGLAGVEEMTLAGLTMARLGLQRGLA